MVLNVPSSLCWVKGYGPNKGCDLDRAESQGQGQGKVGCAPQWQPPSKAGHLRRRLTCISVTFYSFFNFWEMIIHFLFTRSLMLLNHGIISFFLSWINTDPNAVLFLWYIWRAQKKRGHETLAIRVKGLTKKFWQSNQVSVPSVCML